MEEIKRRYSFNTGPRFKEQASPSTPASGFVEIYAKTDGRMYLKDDLGAELELGPRSAVVELVHGATAATARTTPAASVLWVGSVRPTNAIVGDLWLYEPTVLTGGTVGGPLGHSLWRRGSNSNTWNHMGGGAMGQGNIEPDPSFETGTIAGLGFNGMLNCTPAISSSFARTGIYSLSATKNGTPAAMMVDKFDSVYNIPCVPGEMFVTSCWEYTPAGGSVRDFTVGISFLALRNDFSGTESWISEAISTTIGAWTYHQTSAICPAGCAFARSYYYWANCAAAEVHYIDDIRFERGLIPSDPASARQTVVHVGTPADAAVLPGTAELYLDTTTGSPKVKAKIKDTAGTTFDLQLGGTSTIFPEVTAPGTPAAGLVVVYAKSDGRMYLKDDTGTEVMMSGAVTFPLLAGTGTLSNPQYSFAADPDTGMFLNAAGDVRIAASGSVGSFGAAVTVVDDGTNGTSSIFARGTGSVRALIGAFAKMTIINANITTTVPILGPNGAAAGPTYAFANDVDSGLFLNAVGDLRLAVGAQNRITVTDDGTNGATIINGGRGTGSLALQWNGTNKWTYFAGVWSSPDPIWGTNFKYAEATAPATPSAGTVVTYALADGKIYSKDDTGVEILMSSGPAGSPTYPLLAPNGSAAAPSYSFSADADSGLFLLAAGDMRVSVGGQQKIIMTDDGTNGSMSIASRGNSSTQILHSGSAHFVVDSEGVSLQEISPVPTTPTGGRVRLYAKTSGLLYSKDDAGVESPVSSPWPQLAPDGSVTAPSYAFANDVDSGMFLNVPGDIRLTAGGAAKFIANDDGTNGSNYIDARGTGMTVFRHGGVNKMFVLADRISFGGLPLSLGEIAAPATPAAGELYAYAKTDGMLYTKNDSGIETPISSIPHTDVVKVGVMAGTTSSTTYVALPTALSKTGFVKYRSDTKLLVTVTGSYWTDDAVCQSYFAIDVAGVDTVIARHDSIAANQAYSFSIIHDFGAVAAGTLGAYAVQWRVNAGTVVATATGYWTLTMTETF